MNSELFVVIWTVVLSIGVFSSNSMFPRENRPTMFRGMWGESFFSFITMSILFGAIALTIWSFMEVTWYVNIAIIFFSMFLDSFIYRFLFLIFENALTPIISLVAMIVLNYIAWSN